MRRPALQLVFAASVFAIFVLYAMRPSVRGNAGAEDLPRPVGLVASYSEEQDRDKFDAPEEFERFHRDIRTRDGEAGPAYPVNYRVVEVQKAINGKVASLSKYAAAI